MAARAWTLFEVEAIVADYLDMLAAELRGERPNKTDHRNALMPKLGGRSKGSVERKHMNISAVMIDLGYPYIDGYKPYVNYQRALLPDVVLEQVESNAEIQALVESQVSGPIVDEPDLEDILAAMVERPLVPARRQRVGEAEREYVPQKPTKVNYLAREARNRALGGAGERFVLKYERARLIAAGKESLAQDVEHTAEVRGDGAGYDILSFDESGRERLIEVKTTQYGALTPFYVSRNELDVSTRESERYHLYRVFDFRAAPRFFTAPGSFTASCDLDPSLYRARLAG